MKANSINFFPPIIFSYSMTQNYLVGPYVTNSAVFYSILSLFCLGEICFSSFSFVVHSVIWILIGRPKPVDEFRDRGKDVYVSIFVFYYYRCCLLPFVIFTLLFWYQWFASFSLSPNASNDLAQFSKMYLFFIRITVVRYFLCTHAGKDITWGRNDFLVLFLTVLLGFSLRLILG